MSSTIPRNHYRPCQAKFPGFMFFCAALTAAAPLTADQTDLERTNQAVVDLQLAWGNDDDPDEGGQLS